MLPSRPPKGPLKLSLAIASANGNAAKVLELLADGADPSARGPGGLTALHFAAGWGHPNCVRALLPSANFEARDNDGRTALQVAIANGSSECAAMIEAEAARQAALAEAAEIDRAAGFASAAPLGKTRL